MFALAALLAQAAPTLPVNLKDASMRCAQVVAVAEGGDSHMRRSAQVSFFMMTAAKADPAGKSFLDRVNDLVPQPDPKIAAVASALLKQCDQRFPQARSMAPVKLPSDPFQRDVMCFGTLALLQGAAQQFETDFKDSAPLGRVKAVFEPLAARMTDDVLTKHGMNSEAAFTTYMGDRLKDSLALGNPETVGKACGLSSL
ncbi:hypothetical protein AB2M62_07255 [Sphingomonas sp. MMS12-HWE2-04]|uniref:hypothetical protein n=1 Tax=Sphingomonas sp. MMS12-HWE2-04 TaxID=3234199 RepID=UPI00384D4EB8